jgi:hypothetical protein
VGPAEGSWRGRVLEIALIVLSVLLAFAINAWWAGAQEQRRARAQIESLQSEFEAVDVELGRAAEELQTAYDATVTLGRLAGPNPSRLLADSLGWLLVHSLTPVVFDLLAVSPAVSAAAPEWWSDENAFEYDPTALLSSREFENLMLGRSITIQIASGTVADAQSLVQTIRAGLESWQ